MGGRIQRHPSISVGWIHPFTAIWIIRFLSPFYLITSITVTSINIKVRDIPISPIVIIAEYPLVICYSLRHRSHGPVESSWIYPLIAWRIFPVRFLWTFTRPGMFRGLFFLIVDIPNSWSSLVTSTNKGRESRTLLYQAGFSRKMSTWIPMKNSPSYPKKLCANGKSHCSPWENPGEITIFWVGALEPWNLMTFHILGMWSSELLLTPSFFRGVGQPPSSKLVG